MLKGKKKTPLNFRCYMEWETLFHVLWILPFGAHFSVTQDVTKVSETKEVVKYLNSQHKHQAQQIEQFSKHLLKI